MNQVVVDVKEVLQELGRVEKLERKLELSPLEKDDESIRFEGPVEADLMLENTGLGVLVSGKVKGTLKITCSRCLCEFDMPAEFRMNDLYSPEPEDEKYKVTDHSIDLGPAIDESFILEIPIAPLCDAACKGLCPVCGGNLNVQECSHEVEEFDHRLNELRKWFEQQEKE